MQKNNLLQNLPRSYATSEKGFFRFGEFSNLSLEEKNILEHECWEYFRIKVRDERPIKIYKNYKYKASGWEWSVFKLNKNKVIKIPGGIFQEVNERKYLINAEKSYQKILKYFPEKFVAKSSFSREDGLNIIRQVLITGKQTFIIRYDEKNKNLLRNVDELLDCCLIMLDEEQWMTDIQIKRNPSGFKFRLLFDKEVPKIFDFTYYYDIFRLYPERTEQEIFSKKIQIMDLKKFIKSRL